MNLKKLTKVADADGGKTVAILNLASGDTLFLKRSGEGFTARFVGGLFDNIEYTDASAYNAVANVLDDAYEASSNSNVKQLQRLLMAVHSNW